MLEENFSARYVAATSAPQGQCGIKRPNDLFIDLWIFV